MKVLIVGGGFGGVKAALELAGTSTFEVSLLSDQQNFRFYPALYETATGKKSSASSIPLSEIFAAKQVKLLKGSAHKLDRAKRQIVTSTGEKHTYDLLILAMGVMTNFFNIAGLEKYAFGIKSLDEAKRLRNHIHKQIVDDKKPDLNYVVIGGGPTGIELAGALPSYIKHVMRNHNIQDVHFHIDLVEAAPRLMPRMDKDYSDKIADHLEKLGVDLYLGQTVQAESAEKLMVSGHSIASHTVIWTAGVTNNPFFKTNDFRLDDHGKVIVDKYLQAEPNIFVIGDNAATTYSGMAQTALHDAISVAANLKRRSRGKSLWPYKPRKPVYITPAGPHWAAVEWNNFRFYGFTGWLLRSLADFAAYHDLEPYWKSSRHWFAAHRDETDCQNCN